MFYVCGEYNEKTCRIDQLFFVLPHEVELTGNYKSGDSLMVNGKEYVLGRRTFDKKATIAQYELLLRKRDNPPALALD